MSGEYKTLAIVGNGFDLALGIKSQFKDFAKSTSFKELGEFKAFCETIPILDDDKKVNRSEIGYWSAFEDRIKQITYERSAVADPSVYNENAIEELKTIDSIFSTIQIELMAYLTEASKGTFHTIDSIKRVIDNQTQVINFNYTDTFETYSDNIFYIHGSLKERDIVLGYDFRPETCMSQAAEVRWSKKNCRHRLEFKRYLRSVLKLDPSSAEYKEFVQAFEHYLKCRDNPRGIKCYDEKDIPKKDDIKKFFDYIDSRGIIPGCDLASIETVIVIGHGLEADEEYLKRVLDSCKSLRSVKIFTFDGEKPDSLENKKMFFAKYCSCIDTINY